MTVKKNKKLPSLVQKPGARERERERENLNVTQKCKVEEGVRPDLRKA